MSQQQPRRRPWEYASAPLTDLMETRFWDLLTATTNPQSENDVEMGDAINEWMSLPPEVREYVGLYLDAAQVRLMEEMRALALRNAAMLRGIRGAIHAMGGSVEGSPQPQPQAQPRRGRQPTNGSHAPPRTPVFDASGNMIDDPFAALDASESGVAIPNEGALVDTDGNPLGLP